MPVQRSMVSGDKAGRGQGLLVWGLVRGRRPGTVGPLPLTKVPGVQDLSNIDWSIHM